jgi:DNA-binding transcriptional LysR family regulator
MMLSNQTRPSMDLKRLKHLVALADTHNFGRAAAQCHLSQPAFSRSIQAAEEELGLQLFDRGTVDVTCTDAGAFVVERARKLVFDSRCLERDVSLYRERLIGDIALGVGPYPAATLVPQLLSELRLRFPGVNTRVEVNNAKYLAEHLRAEELDFYVADLRNVPTATDVVFTRIGQLSAGFYVREGHPLLSTSIPNAAALMPYGLASVHIPDPVLLLLAPLMGLAEGSRLPLAVECDDLNLLKTVALTTDTVLACADAGARQEVASGRLVRLRVLNLPTLYSDMGVVSLKGRSYSPMAQFAVDFLTQLVQKHAEELEAGNPSNQL